MSVDDDDDPESTSFDQHISDFNSKAKSAVESLYLILDSLPPSISFSSEIPISLLLHDPELSQKMSFHLRQPNSGAGDNNLCRWLYDTFQSSDPSLQLVVLRFLPIIAGIYLSRAILRKPLAGFEAILLALYAHETTSRGGQPITVNLPDLSHPSLYHESKTLIKNNATELSLAVLSPSLEPHGTVRSTKRARIVGVALELYYSKIAQMPVSSKIDFCEFCVIWAGQKDDMPNDDKKETEKVIGTSSKSNQDASHITNKDGLIVNDVSKDGEGGVSTSDNVVESDKSANENVTESDKDGIENVIESDKDRIDNIVESENNNAENIVEGEKSTSENVVKSDKSSKEECEEKLGRVPFPWELLQPTLRILSHCLMGPNSSKELKDAAVAASRSLYARALHDVNSQAILATGSLLRLGKLAMASDQEHDPTEIRDFANNVITL